MLLLQGVGAFYLCRGTPILVVLPTPRVPRLLLRLPQAVGCALLNVDTEWSLVQHSLELVPTSEQVATSLYSRMLGSTASNRVSFNISREDAAGR